jgi:putative oxidoreductase
MSAKQWLESVCLQFPLRVGLGGAFCFAAWTKLGDVQSFAEAIKGFQVVDADSYEFLILSAAYTMPWVEMIAGALLILGLWTRAASATIGIMLIVFMAALMHVIFDDNVSADCSCFGDISVVCSNTVGWCQVLRDVVLLVPSVYLIWRGGGVLALDMLNSRKLSAAQGSQSPQGVDDQELRG